MLKRKSFSLAKNMLFSLSISIIGVLILHPYILNQLTSSSRGTEAIGNFSNLSGFYERIQSFAAIINNNIFGGFSPIIIIIGIAILIAIVAIRIMKRNDYNFNVTIDMIILLSFIIITMVYFVSISLIAPYQDMRYIIPIFPLISIIIVMFGTSIKDMLGVKRGYVLVPILCLIIAFNIITTPKYLSYLFKDIDNQFISNSFLSNTLIVVTPEDKSWYQWSIFMTLVESKRDVLFMTEKDVLENRISEFIESNQLSKEGVLLIAVPTEHQPKVAQYIKSAGGYDSMEHLPVSIDTAYRYKVYHLSK
jgi:hypothetical protein